MPWDCSSGSLRSRRRERKLRRHSATLSERSCYPTPRPKTGAAFDSVRTTSSPSFERRADDHSGDMNPCQRRPPSRSTTSPSASSRRGWGRRTRQAPCGGPLGRGLRRRLFEIPCSGRCLHEWDVLGCLRPVPTRRPGANEVSSTQEPSRAGAQSVLRHYSYAHLEVRISRSDGMEPHEMPNSSAGDRPRLMLCSWKSLGGSQSPPPFETPRSIAQYDGVRRGHFSYRLRLRGFGDPHPSPNRFFRNRFPAKRTQK